MLDIIFSWNTLWWLLLVIYVPAAILLMIIVLMQRGKGAGFAGAFGAGPGPGSDTVFGPKSNRTVPVRLTYTFAAVFMAAAILMSIIADNVGRGTAPELVQEEGEAAVGSSLLERHGLGEGYKGAGQDTATTTTEPAASETSAQEDTGTAVSGEATETSEQATPNEP